MSLVRTHNSKTARPNFTEFFYACCLWQWLDPPLTALRYIVLPVLRITSCFHTMEPMGGRTGMALCSSPALVDVAAGTRCSTLARWLGGQACCGSSVGPDARCPWAGPWTTSYCTWLLLDIHGWTRLLPGTMVRVSLCASC